MMMRQKLIVSLTIMTCLLGAGSASAAASASASAATSAERYPTKAVRFVVPYPPGGAADHLARLIAQGLSTQWGQPVTVDNRPGGATAIAAREVARSEPDGYTIM